MSNIQFLNIGPSHILIDRIEQIDHGPNSMKELHITALTLPVSTNKLAVATNIYVRTDICQNWEKVLNEERAAHLLEVLSLKSQINELQAELKLDEEYK